MTYPTLSRRPIRETRSNVDNTIRHETESNHVVRRVRSTRERYTWELEYDLLPASDASQLIALYDQVKCAGSFAWTDKRGKTTSAVFEEPLSYSEPFTNWFQFDTIKLTEV